MAPSQPKPEEAGFDQVVCERFGHTSDFKDDMKKSADVEASNFESVLKQPKDVMGNAQSSTRFEMLDALKLAATALERETRDTFWMTDAGQTELPRSFDGNARPP